MSEAIIKNEILEYSGMNPFHIHNILSNDPVDGYTLHWHTELEIVYVFHGSSIHYIDGNYINASANKIIVVNSESVHSIIPDPKCANIPEVIAVVILISTSYLKKLIPDFENIYFVAPERKCKKEIGNLMKNISKHMLSVEKKTAEKNKNETLADTLYIKGLIDLLLSYLCRYGARQKDLIMPINHQRNIKRVQEILSYIQNHYSEPIRQTELAEKFYISNEYFSRFFKKYIGINFVEYLTYYRVSQSKKDILYSEKNILTIALENGFSDSRRLINAFKKHFNVTPLQYRKEHQDKSSR